MQEMILDVVTDLVDFDGRQEAENARASFRDRTARVRDILVRDPLRDTLCHIARMADGFKPGNLFRPEWLTPTVMKSPMGDVSDP